MSGMSWKLPYVLGRRLPTSNTDVPISLRAMTLTPFTVVADFAAVADEGVRPMSGTVTFTPMLKEDCVRTLVEAEVSSGALVLQRVQATIAFGQLQKWGRRGVKLVANTPVLKLPDLFYQVRFFDLRAFNGAGIAFDPFTFRAPTSDVSLDLLSVAPDPLLLVT